MGGIPRKNPGEPRVLQIFPAERSIKEPATGQNHHSEKKYVLSRNVVKLLNIFSLIVFAFKALKGDVLC